MEAEDAATRRPPSLATGLRDLAGAVTLGAFACSVVFDAQSQRAGDQLVYARGAYTLVCIGLAVGVVAAVLGAMEVASLRRGTDAFRAGVRMLVGADAVLAWFALSYLVRHGEPFSLAPLWLLGGSGLAVLAAAWLRWRARTGPPVGAGAPPS